MDKEYLLTLTESELQDLPKPIVITVSGIGSFIWVADWDGDLSKWIRVSNFISLASDVKDKQPEYEEKLKAAHDYKEWKGKRNANEL